MDIENANCKQRLSECTTDIDISYIERPLVKVAQEITGLEKLVEELHNIFSHDHVNVQDVQKLMAGYKSDPKDWRKYAKFDRFRYTRNLVDAGNGAFNMMILCWGPGHASAIHDHADSHCFMKVLSGKLEEVRYDWPKHVQPEVIKKIKDTSKPRRRCCSENEDRTSNKASDVCQNDSCQNFGGRIDNGQNGDYDVRNMVETGRTGLEVNDVCYINDALGLHRMENPSHVDGAVSLHLYSPPFDSCRVFDSRTGKPTEVKVTFWSMYGKKVKHVIEANNNLISDSQ
ncbi:hypothetical protein O0L34_g13434 [Tuta absoluta]|nr:hypothetical protein O0L34_g13434 [Tuta absoluta]